MKDVVWIDSLQGQIGETPDPEGKKQKKQSSDDERLENVPTWKEAAALFRASTQHLRGGDGSQQTTGNGAKLQNNAEITKGLDDILTDINKNGAYDRSMDSTSKFFVKNHLFLSSNENNEIKGNIINNIFPFCK